jgi:hypothetical protein
MALHRDIYWVGRQWAVTGFGMQAIDQRLKGSFDVEATRLWEEDLPQRMRALSWLNIEEFNKALDMARARFPEPARKKSLPLVESVLELIQPPVPEPARQQAPREEHGATPSAIMAMGLPEPGPPQIDPPQAELPEVAQPDVSFVEAGPTPAIPPVVEVERELLQAKAAPLAMRIEHVSAKFLPRWRVRHGRQYR